MKYFILVNLLCVMLSAMIFPKPYFEWYPEVPFSTYVDNYILIHPEDTKLQFGFKYSMIGNLYFTYNQIFWWDLFSKNLPSAQMKDVNYMPGMMYRLTLLRGWFRYLQAGYEHKSNGKGGVDDRSVDKWYAISLIEIPMGPLALSWENKWNKYFKIASKNKDLTDYVGFTYQSFSLKIVDRIGDSKIVDQSLSFSFMGLTQSPELSFTIGTKVRFLFTKSLFKNKFHPMAYLEYQRGYWNSFLEYDKFDSIFRAGIVFN